MTEALFLTGILHGMILAIVTYAIMIPFRLLDFPDLSAEGAYPVGGAVYASALLFGVPPIQALLLAATSAGLVGVATSLASITLRVNSLLAGIIISTMAYSVNLRIMGRPNISLFDAHNILGDNGFLENCLVLASVVVIYVVPLMLFLHTDFGLRLRAVGLGKTFARKHSISVARYTVLGLFIAGFFSGTAGSLAISLQNYMDINMGVGIVIHALAALMIGEAIVGSSTITKQLIAPLVGALVYQQIQGISLTLGLAPSDLKFFTGALLLCVLAMRRRSDRS